MALQQRLNRHLSGGATPRRLPLVLLAACVSVGAILVAGPTSSQPAGAKARTDIKKQLIGTWRITSAPVRDAEGNTVGSLYKDPVGKVTYTQRGEVWAFIGQRHRTGPSDPQLWYTGTFEVDQQAHEVIHHVRFASNGAGIEHGDQVRHYNLRGDRLVLSFALTPKVRADVHLVRAN